MKQKFLLKTMLLLCTLMGGVNSAWGQTTYSMTIDSSNNGSNNAHWTSTSTTSLQYNNVTWSTSVTGTTSVTASTTYAQIGSKNSPATQVTISTTAFAGKEITAVSLTGFCMSNTGPVLTITAGSTTILSSAALVKTTSTTYNATANLLPVILGNNEAITFTISSSAKAAICISEISVTYEDAPTPTHTLTYSATNGSISGVDAGSNAVASGGSIAEGATVTLTATPSSGYEFSSWSVIGDGSTLSSTTDNPTTFTMGTADATVTANFVATATSDYITVSPTTTNVVVAGNDEVFTITTDQTLDDDPTIFYTTSEGTVTTTTPDWITDALYMNGELIVSVAANTGAARTAYFRVEKGSVKSDVITINQAAQTYTIEQYADPATAHGTITFTPSSSVATGVEVTLTATPDEGYTFTTDSWVIYKQSGEDFVVDNSITVTDNQFTMPAYAVYVDGTFTAIAVTGVTLNKSTASIGVGDTETLTATVAPSNALNKAVTWTSNNTGVATVDNGIVTGVAVGSATITATTTDGSFTATCTVTVENVVTFTAGTDKGSTTSNNSADEVSKSGVTISSTDAALATAEYRLYSGSTNTISVTSGKITKIEFTKNGSYSLSNLSKTTGSAGTYESSTGVWTGVASSVAFTASAQVRLDKIKVFVANTATPTFDVAEGTYDVAQNVIISCTTDGASIYYTNDGTTPTSSSTEYTSAIHITETTTLKAIAIKDEVESAVASATYMMNRPAAPTFDVEEGIFNAAFTLHLSAADGATIYYTTNGDTPTSSSTEYSDGISIPAATTTVKSIAVKSGLTSDVAKVTYTYDTRPAPTFTLSAIELNLKVNETSSAVSLTTNSDGAVTFSCDNAAVTLTGTGNSRTISANAAGEYTVNVATAATENYLAGAGTITVTVTKKATTMVLTPTFTSKDLYVTKAGSLTGVPQYNSADVAGAEVTYTSSNTSVATIASDGAVTFKKVGTTTLTASYAGNDEYEECEATYVLDLVDTTPQATEVEITLNNTFFGCSAFTSYAANSPTSYTGTQDNVEVSYAKGSGSGFYCNTSGLRLYSGGSLTFTAPANYYITKIVFTGESGFFDGLTNPDRSSTWNGESASSVEITGETKSGSNRKNMTGATVTLAPTITFGAKGYASYCSPHALNLDLSEKDYAAWAVTDVNGTAVTFTKITSSVPAETPFILYGGMSIAGETVSIPVATGETTAVSNNMLVGTLVPTVVYQVDGDYTNFGLSMSNGDFRLMKTDGSNVPANKAYLHVPTSKLPSSPSSRMTIVFNDETTGISTIEDGRWLMDNAVYDLQGRRVETPRKGSLYIVNGKKVVF